MNPTYKAAWLDALRSGKYRQGLGALRQRDRYCCLGVLCDVVAPEDWKLWDENDERHRYAHQGSIDAPSDTIYGITGLPASQAGNLADMNDSGQTFEQIANYIERDL